MVCKTPGRKIKSRGQGRGLAKGQGKGPMGVPIGKPDDAYKGRILRREKI
jgi:hypothetical protein